MKTLKLEVGKTYRNRRGEGVKITSCDGGYYHPYQGSNGGLYAESGRWGYGSKENPEDLIEEVTTSDANQKHNEMEVLVLQVGKTYRNRKGEEVRIVRKTANGRPPYQGSDGEWYTGSGKWGYAYIEFPADLIEEVEEIPSETRHTFTTPDKAKEVTFEQVGARITVEMAPEIEPGSVMVNDSGSAYIFKAVVNDNTHRHYAWFGATGRLSIGGTCYPGRPATPEEAKPLWDALRKAWKRWNPETMKIEDVPERERIMDLLKGYAIDTTWSREQLCWLIEGYLKYREGKK